MPTKRAHGKSRWLILPAVAPVKPASGLLLLVLACTSAPREGRPGYDSPVITTGPDSIVTTRTRFEAKHQDLWRAQLGAIAVVARATEDPTTNIPNARARLRARDDTSRAVRQIAVPVDGVRLDSLPLGDYILEVAVPVNRDQPTSGLAARINVPLQVRRGCTAYVEVYLRTRFNMCEYGTCLMPREYAILTTCREA